MPEISGWNDMNIYELSILDTKHKYHKLDDSPNP